MHCVQRLVKMDAIVSLIRIVVAMLTGFVLMFICGATIVLGHWAISVLVIVAFFFLGVTIADNIAVVNDYVGKQTDA